MKTTCLFISVIFITLPLFAQQTLRVNLANKIRPVTHCASGSLYGVTETLPSDIANLVAPLNPHVFANPAQSGPGKQQPIGDALKVSERLQNTTGKVQVRLPDVLPGWPYRWPGLQSFLSTCTDVINAKKASGRTNYDGYEIWNEPYGTWNNANGSFFSACWKPTFDLIRSLDPGERIIGPSLAYYNNNRMRDFLTYCKANNCIPDVVCWHQWGAAGFVNAYNQYRALEKELGISPRPISINEYSSKTSDPNEGCPGYSVPFISKFERHGIESACISWWFTNLPGRLGSLLTANNQKGGGWHLYKWYGDMTGDMVQVTPPNDFSEGLDGFACIDDANKYASICIGGNFTGNATVNIDGIPSYFGNSVKVKLEYVTWSNKDTPVASTNLISNTVSSVNNGSITVPVNVSSIYYAYRIYIEPSVSTPSVTIAIPTKDTVVVNPSSVLLRANVSEPADIISLKFYANGEQLGNTLTAAPFTRNFNITEAGVYTITAEIVDKNNNVIVSPARIIRTVVPQAAYNFQPHAIPGTIQLEEYDFGGNGFAYFDDTPGSETDVAFRTDEDVDIENCTDAGGGYNIGYATAGEWLEYTVNVARTGTYNLDLRVACSGEARTLDLTVDGQALAANIAVPNTTGWQIWETISVDSLQLTAGEHILRLTIGNTDYINLNYMTFEEIVEILPPVITLNSPINQAIFSNGETVVMSATASDPDGNIVGVSFYEGDNLLTTVNTAPYTYNWSGVAPGVYTISAEAFDTDGLSTKTSSVSIIVQGEREPFNTTPHVIPGRIEAEEYDLGGQGVGYNEVNTNGNQGGATFRNDEVDIEETEDVDGDYNIGYTLTGEWLEYTVNVLNSGSYDLELRVAKDGDGGLFHIEMDGEDVTGAIEVPNTGGWQVWETITLTDVDLTAGEQIMRIVFDTDYTNFNYGEFKGVVTNLLGKNSKDFSFHPNPFTNNLYVENLGGVFNYQLINISGQVVQEGTSSGQIYIEANQPKGVYMLKIIQDSTLKMVKVLKE